MSNATILDAYVPTDDATFDGYRWLRFGMDSDSYDEFKSWPRVLAYDGKMFQKMSWNSDNKTISYKQVLKVATPA